jgi:glycosyltransferase involved in cell wall biosynthesis
MKKPFTIFHVDSERGLRGGERQLLYLAAALRAHGHKNVIYCRAHSPLDREAVQQGFVTRHLPFFNEWDPISAYILAREAKRHNAIIHAHTGHAAAIGTLATLLGASYIAHRRVDFPVSRLSRILKYSRANVVVAVSKAIAYLLKQSGVPDRKLSVIYDALPVTTDEFVWTNTRSDQFTPLTSERRHIARVKLASAHAIDANKQWVGNCAALVPHKDHGNLIAAAAIVLKARPHTQFLIAGEGPERSHLEQQIQDLSLTDKVFLIGYQNDSLSLLKMFDLYVQSSWGEGMGSVLIEAKACQIPIVATSVGGIPEVVQDSQSGLLVPARNPEALAHAIIQLLDDRRIAGQFATTGYSELAKFSLSAMSNAIENIYDSIA